MPVTPVCVPSPNVGQHGYVTIVDGQGYVIGTIASSDGAAFGSISGESQFLFNNGGPPLLDGSPSQQSFDRMRGIMGKNNASATVNATATGDTILTCSSGSMKSIMPGQAIRLTGGASFEYTYVADSYLPVYNASTIPLRDPIVIAGSTVAVWDKFADQATLSNQMLPTGVPPVVMSVVDATNVGMLRPIVSGGNDLILSANTMAVAALGYNGSNLSERMRSPNIFKSFAAQAVTASTANTPTAIWTPASSNKFRLMGYWFSTTVAAGLVFHDLATAGGSGLLGIPSPIYPAGGIIQSPPIGNGYLSTANNNKLWIDATSATTLTGFVWGTEE